MDIKCRNCPATAVARIEGNILILPGGWHSFRRASGTWEFWCPEHSKAFVVADPPTPRLDDRDLLAHGLPVC